ncbi:MAG TPA: hypothetical protein VKY92_12190 [Verrucomicrobiae bacterium]|nr:hypothetical protein [Verrucomicrobiae bacterium]
MKMSPFGNNFTRVHAFVAGGLLAAFMALVLFGCLMGWEHIRDLPLVLRATLAVVTGPFDGPIARPGDWAAWMAARWCLPVCASFLVLGALCQLIPLPFRRGAFAFRIGTWTVGWFLWLAGAILSLMNALD